MTRSLGGALTPALVERFSQRDLARRLGTALPFVTVDPDGRPHPMLLSYLELRAYDTGTVGLGPSRVSRQISGSSSVAGSLRWGTSITVTT